MCPLRDLEAQKTGIISAMHAFQAVDHLLMSVFGAIMEGSKNAIPGNGRVSIIAFEVAVVQVVKIFRFDHGLVDLAFFIPAVIPRRSYGCSHQIVARMNRMGRNDPMNEHAR